MCGEGTRPGGRGLRPPPPGAVWHSACWCRGFLVEFCCPGRTDSQGLGLWGRQALLLTDGCAVRGCGAPALGSAQPGSALLCPHFGSPATPAPPPPLPPGPHPQHNAAVQLSVTLRKASRGAVRGGEMRDGDAGRRSDQGVGQRGRGVGVRVGVRAGARGRVAARGPVVHHCAHVFGACTRVRSAPHP